MLISMNAYHVLYRQKLACKDEGVRLEFDRQVVEKDLKKRKRARVAIAVMLIFWIIVGAALIVLRSLTGLLDGILGGSSPVILIIAVFIAATWSLCWVGFPVGWNFGASERYAAKSQAYLNVVIYENGEAEAKVDTFSPKAGAFIVSLFMGCLTLALSVPIAVIKLFSIGSDIKFIKKILN